MTTDALSPPVAVSAVTVLLPWQSFGVISKSLLFCVVNLDTENSVTATVDTTELVDSNGYGYVDTDKQVLMVIAPLCQGSTEVGEGALRRFFRLSVESIAVGHPEVQVRFLVREVPNT